MPLVDRLRTSARSLADWSWPAKFLVGAAVAALAGGGVLSFMLETATHTFALSYGFRPPVEGLPYLRTLVTLGSVILLLCAALFATLFIGAVGGIVRVASGGKHPLHAIATWKAVLFSLTVCAAASLLVWYGTTERWHGIYCMWPLVSCDRDSREVWQAFVASMFVNVPLMLVIFRPHWAWMLALAWTLWYYAGLALSILPPDGYARLLRATGFGGGTPAHISFLAGDTGCASQSFTGFLLLRTTDTFVLYDPPNARISEVPARCVLTISYSAGGLSSLPFQLPPKNQILTRRRTAA